MSFTLRRAVLLSAVVLLTGFGFWRESHEKCLIALALYQEAPGISQDLDALFSDAVSTSVLADETLFPILDTLYEAAERVKSGPHLFYLNEQTVEPFKILSAKPPRLNPQ